MAAPIKVGNLTVLPIFDGTAKLSAEMFTTSQGPSDWTDHQHHLEPDNTFTVPVGGFVVESAGKTILFDAGVGKTDGSDPMFVGGELLISLRAYGLSPIDIDTVIVSHLHSDHMGWLEDNGQSVFAKAEICVGAADWEYFVTQAGGGRKRAGRLAAAQSQVRLIDEDEVALAPNVTSMLTPGHTPGHLSSVIANAGERIVILGDALHCPAQLTEPEWEFLYDTDPVTAKASRAILLRQADVSGTQLLPCHFPGMVATRLVASASPRRWLIPGGSVA